MPAGGGAALLKLAAFVEQRLGWATFVFVATERGLGQLTKGSAEVNRKRHGTLQVGAGLQGDGRGSERGVEQNHERATKVGEGTGLRARRGKKIMRKDGGETLGDVTDASVRG
jgi:hypothetical protein